jgi:hypothetical protein
VFHHKSSFCVCTQSYLYELFQNINVELEYNLAAVDTKVEEVVIVPLFGNQ